MSFLKIFVTVSALVLVPIAAHAQSAFEKAFVSKSRLNSPVWKKHDPASTTEIDHSMWDAFLGKYVSTDGSGVNRVAYGNVTAAYKTSLQTYLHTLQSTDVTRLNRNEQYAFWLNLYNASMVNVILQDYPVKSVFDIKSGLLDVKGPFNDKVANVNGQALTLDDIESGIVRPVWNDPLLHYGFNCAAVSCPNLGKTAYRGSTINAQLRDAAVKYVNNPRGVTVTNGKITASKIYFWYSQDFGSSEQDVLAHIRQFANDNLKQQLSGKTRIDGYEYDWALNGR